ncbi:MAG: DMT family transporter [Pseudomonadota bacterium]
MNTETLALERTASRSPVLAQMLLCSFLWANSYLLMKLIGADVAPLPLTALRGLMGGGLLALWVLWRGQAILPRGREWRDWAVLGLLQGLIPNTLTAYALSQIAAGLTSMMQATTPLMVAVLAHFLFADERLSLRRLLGVLVGFAGMAVLIGPSGESLQSGSFWGALAMIATAVSYALGSLYVRSIPVAQPARLALGQQAFSGIPATFAVLLFLGPDAFAAVPEHALALVALGIFATALPIVLFMNILRRAGPTLGSMNGYLTPAWTVLLGFFILGETTSVNEIAGGVIVLLGVLLANERRPARPG